jgi:Tfp pilus assembly protein PilW
MFAAVGAFTFHSARSFVALANYTDLDVKSRYALDLISREIRQANAVTSSTSITLTGGQVVTNQLTLSGTATNGTAYTLNYYYNPTAKTLTRTFVQGGTSLTNVLLKECSFLSFGMYQRNAISNSFDQFDMTIPGTCKVVQLYWICSRSIFGKSANTESVQSAKVVIRKG